MPGDIRPAPPLNPNNMKKIIIFICSWLFAGAVFGQQLPLSENYFIDNYSLSSAYAGTGSEHVFFASYRRDWTGLSEGPNTIRVSYNDKLAENAGFGAKIILDKIGIFESMFAIGSYSYKVKITDVSALHFGLSAGIHQNTLNFSEYYNDPNFTTDPSMINKDVKSKMKFISDFSAVFCWNRFHSGALFSNVGISDYKYTDVDVKYSPFMTYQFHASYAFPIQDLWTLTPMMIYRGGSNSKNQTEFASHINYKEKIWGNLAWRGKNIFCVGFGMDISKGFLFNYNYNLSTATTVNAFQNHELSIGIRLGDLFEKQSSLALNE